jgi:hypothetical protein
MSSPVRVEVTRVDQDGATALFVGVLPNLFHEALRDVAAERQDRDAEPVEPRFELCDESRPSRTATLKIEGCAAKIERLRLLEGR